MLREGDLWWGVEERNGVEGENEGREGRKGE